MFSKFYGFWLKLAAIALGILVGGAVLISLGAMVGCTPKDAVKQAIAGSDNEQYTETKALDTKSTALAVKNETDQSDHSKDNRINFAPPVALVAPAALVAPVAPVVAPPSLQTIITPVAMVQDAPAENMCAINDPNCGKPKLTEMDKVNIEQNAAINAKIVQFGAAMNQMNQNMNGFTQLLAGFQNSYQQQAEAARAAIDARGRAEAEKERIRADQAIAINAEKEKKWQYAMVAIILIAAVLIVLAWFKQSPLKKKATA